MQLAGQFPFLKHILPPIRRFSEVGRYTTGCASLTQILAASLSGPFSTLLLCLLVKASYQLYQNLSFHVYTISLL